MDYNTLSGTAVIPATKNSVVVALNVKDDLTIESAETVIVNITGGTSGNEVEKKRCAIGAATSPPERPPSTSTASARSSRVGDEPARAWAAGHHRRYSAVPLLPRTSPGIRQRRAGAARSRRERIRLAQRRPPGHPRQRSPAWALGALARTRGARQRPSADRGGHAGHRQRARRGSGPGRSSSPRGPTSSPSRDGRRRAGTSSAAPRASRRSRSRARPRAGRARSSRSASETNAVLQLCAKSVLNGHGAARTALEVGRNGLPSTPPSSADIRHGPGLRARPRSSAAVQTTLKVEPGG